MPALAIDPTVWAGGGRSAMPLTLLPTADRGLLRESGALDDGGHNHTPRRIKLPRHPCGPDAVPHRYVVNPAFGIPSVSGTALISADIEAPMQGTVIEGDHRVDPASRCPPHRCSGRHLVRSLLRRPVAVDRCVGRGGATAVGALVHEPAIAVRAEFLGHTLTGMVRQPREQPAPGGSETVPSPRSARHPNRGLVLWAISMAWVTV